MHRLNRTEYTNAIRDLLGLEIDGRALLPADEADQQGFDNVASVLSVSPALLESYLSAARTISRLAVGDPALHPVVDTFKISKALVQDERISDDLPFGSRGGALIRYHFPLDGEYTIKVLLRRQLYDYIIGMGEPHQLDVRLDGVRVKRFTVGGEGEGHDRAGELRRQHAGRSGVGSVHAHRRRGLEVRVPVKAGTARSRRVVRAADSGSRKASCSRRRPASAARPTSITTAIRRWRACTIGGPYDGGSHAPRRASPSRRKVFVCRPTDAAAEEPCARKILSTLARARLSPAGHRGDVADAARLLPGAAGPRTGFDAGIQRGLERILAAPSFLFRIEREPAGIAAGSAYRLSDLDLASRLSFFLWSSIPDDELRDAAVRGKLKRSGGARAAGPRMLRDPRSQALVDNFASRWLELSKLAGVVPDAELYPEFDENLREAMEQETQLFVGSQLREDRSVVELLTANYTFLNERLAQHYGIPNVYGSHFRRVTFADGMRGGLLGQASILTVTSYPNRTSVRARQMAAREPARRAAAAAAARRAGAQGSRRRRAAAFGARADGGAPEESGVRVVSSADGSAGVRARELRRARQVAHGQRRRADRCVGVVAGRHAVRRRRRPARRCSSATRKTSSARSPRSCWPTRSAAASTITTCPRSADRARRGAGRLLAGRRSSSASSRARRSAWRVASGEVRHGSEKGRE